MRSRWLGSSRGAQKFPLQIRVVAGICHEAKEFLGKCACYHPVRGILARSGHKLLDKVLNNRHVHGEREARRVSPVDLNFANQRRLRSLGFIVSLELDEGEVRAAP